MFGAASYIPGTKPWRGKRTADAVHVEFAKCATACKINMAKPGAVPLCVADHWCLHMMQSERLSKRIAAVETLEKPTNLIREFTNEEIADTLFTFLFVSQDASSSSTTWIF